ncbi:MAG: peptidoglycan-binding protein [Candidatus Omnitrophica bacterium]|nr:peptidoglycan-binding protein [Candidatus Omnitrophota bacterium]
MIAVLALIVSGCATTSKQVGAPLQTQVVELQQRVEDQEKEIVDLKYEVRELSSADKATDDTAKPVVKSEPVKASEPKNLDIIHVDVSARELQKALKGAGLYDGKIDGKIGSRTKAAVVEFQKAHSLKADGVVGQKTWNELKAYLNPSTEAAEGSSK